MHPPSVEELRARYANAQFEEIDPMVLARIEAPEGRHLAAELGAAARMIAEAKTLRAVEDLPPMGTRPRILTILHSCLPWLPGGYSGRAHGILEHLVGTGAATLALTRPGFLADTRNEGDTAGTQRDLVGNVVYQHVESPLRRVRGEFQYMESVIGIYSRVIHRFRPTVVHLRSSYPSALPGLIAARRAGVPAVYEVSGLWELVHDGRGLADLATRTRALEATVMSNVDSIVTLTRAMKRLIETDYAPAARVVLAPNAVNIDHFYPVQQSRREVPVVGYVGSLVDYEGLELLVRSIAILLRRGRAVKGLVVGGGPELPRLRALVEELDLSDAIELRGPVDPLLIPQIYREIDIAPLPRLSTPATEVVSPLKPFEAMAMALPLVVSDVAALAEIVEESGAGVTFRQGDVVDLADKLQQLLDMPDSGAALGQRGRQFVERQHTWEAVGASLHATLLTAGRRPAS